MSNIWTKLKEKITNLFQAKPKKKKVAKTKKDYLSDLITKLEKAQKKQDVLQFEIKSAKRNGFVVKVSGLYAFVSFYHMPWQYRSIEQWRSVSKYLIGKKFNGIVHSISAKSRPVKILLNAEKQNFDKLQLVDKEQYNCVIIQRLRFGFVVDLGYHFGWKYGSIVGLIHKSSFKSDEELISAKLGDIVQTYYHGRKKNGDPILGDKNVNKELLTGELDDLIGSVQTAVLKKDSNGRRSFFIKEKYKTIININPEIFPDEKSTKKIIEDLYDNAVVKCKVIRMSNKNNFVSDLLEIETPKKNIDK